MKKLFYWMGALLTMVGMPVGLRAQTVSGSVNELHGVLQNVYDQMIPMCAQITDVCRAIAGLGTIFYIGARVWAKIASAQPIEVYPLLRPCMIVLLIGIFPAVLGVINGVLKPTVTATSALVTHYNDAVHALLIAQAKAITTGDNDAALTTPGAMGNQPGWDKYAQPGSTTSGSGGGLLSAIGQGFKFIAGGFIAGLRMIFKLLLSVLLEMLYYAASLCIDTIRTFHLIVLAILGPFAFAFSCFDNMQNSLTQWLTRYINVYLWLPVANLFGAILSDIQANMLQLDLARAQSGSLTLFSATDIAYLIFLAIGTVGYFTVPGVANYIIHAHGGNPILKTISDKAGMNVSGPTAMATGGAGGVGMAGASGTGSSSIGASSQINQFNRDRITG